jgi:hypothetical protein
MPVHLFFIWSVARSKIICHLYIQHLFSRLLLVLQVFTSTSNRLYWISNIYERTILLHLHLGEKNHSCLWNNSSYSIFFQQKIVFRCLLTCGIQFSYETNTNDLGGSISSLRSCLSFCFSFCPFFLLSCWQFVLFFCLFLFLFHYLYVHITFFFLSFLLSVLVTIFLYVLISLFLSFFLPFLVSLLALLILDCKNSRRVFLRMLRTARTELFE